MNEQQQRLALMAERLDLIAERIDACLTAFESAYAALQAIKPREHLLDTKSRAAGMRAEVGRVADQARWAASDARDAAVARAAHPEWQPPQQHPFLQERKS